MIVLMTRIKDVFGIWHHVWALALAGLMIFAGGPFIESSGPLGNVGIALFLAGLFVGLVDSLYCSIVGRGKNSPHVRSRARFRRGTDKGQRDAHQD